MVIDRAARLLEVMAMHQIAVQVAIFYRPVELIGRYES